MNKDQLKKLEADLWSAADNLALSVKTVSTYRSRILEKMRLNNNAELMRYAVDNHLAQ
jgi:two-component system invasion response regulator UvrY